MFEDYLKDVFMDSNPLVTKENFEEQFMAWLNRLDPLEWLLFGENYGTYLLKKLK